MKLSLLETLMDTLYATCIPVITDCTYTDSMPILVRTKLTTLRRRHGNYPSESPT
jgi:hypothetical protein